MQHDKANVQGIFPAVVDRYLVLLAPEFWLYIWIKILKHIVADVESPELKRWEGMHLEPQIHGISFK